MHSVLAGGSGEGSPQLQHELIIPQWKTAEGPMKEKVKLQKISFLEAGVDSSILGHLLSFPVGPVITVNSPSFLCMGLEVPDGTSLHCVTNF